MKKNEKGVVNVFATIVIIILLCIIGFLIWWFGFHNNNNNNTTTNNNQKSSQPTDQQKKAAIKDNWTKFFAGSTPAQTKIGLLQNGQDFAPVINAEAKTPTAKATSATVSDVALNGNDTATVTYTIDINGKPALSNQKGQAVKVNGTWKVGDAAFCGLLQLSGNTPPNCPGVSGQQSQQSQQSQQQPQSQSTKTQSTTNQ